ncbi:MAG: type II toxin-antitoxin system VapC family toxin [Planctomycetes bacterium]|nr:type II toxin-antitoxin system VapC family toxin [Planctomycetota bacterium]
MAWSLGEPGKDRVTEALDAGAAISAANWAEFLTKAAETGEDPDALSTRLTKLGILGTLLSVHPLDEAAAREVARLRTATRAAGLSLGDRACLALAKALGLPALTADRAWARVKLGVTVRVIR